jgi:hypothetical protein
VAGVRLATVLIDVVALLHRVEQLETTSARHDRELQELRASTLSRRDRARLGVLLPTIAGSIGSAWFTVAELFGSSAPGLQLALEGLSPRSCGRLLRRAVQDYLR